jgi:cytochrome b6-f complex iron-sulfur subunit
MEKLPRRKFLKFMGWGMIASAGAAVFAPVVAFFYPPKLEEMPSEPVLVSPQSDLPVGTSKTVRFGRYPALVINTPQGLRAYSAVCTHFACIVKWDAEKQRIECPCHEGYFSAEDGSVTHGPAPTPLAQLQIEIVNGEIYVGNPQ